MPKLTTGQATSILTIYVVLSLGYPAGELHHMQTTQQEENKNLVPLFSSEYKSPVENGLQYDFYRDKCPAAEQIISSTMKDLFLQNPKISPALLRLVFHDCFIRGCDASVLLDSVDGIIDSEKEAVPNESLKGFDAIDTVKAKLEEECPGVVSCADIVVIAARDAIVLAGGPYYPVMTGRRDSTEAFKTMASEELPPPNNELAATLTSFGKRGFVQRETVSLLGAHSIGSVHCTFIRDRLFDFDQTGVPDPTIDKEFLGFLQQRCANSSGSGVEREQIVNMISEKPSTGFNTHYFKGLIQGKAILRADQQLMASSSTAALVRDYASDDGFAFRRDFARAMIKMSGLGVLTGSRGVVRFNCSMLNPSS